MQEKEAFETFQTIQSQFDHLTEHHEAVQHSLHELTRSKNAHEASLKERAERAEQSMLAGQQKFDQLQKDASAKYMSLGLNLEKILDTARTERSTKSSSKDSPKKPGNRSGRTKCVICCLVTGLSLFVSLVSRFRQHLVCGW